MITAEELLIEHNGDDSWTNNEDAKDAMIEFAKLHVAAALKAAAKACDDELEKDFINEKLILNSYSLENIK